MESQRACVSVFCASLVRPPCDSRPAVRRSSQPSCVSRRSRVCFHSARKEVSRVTATVRKADEDDDSPGTSFYWRRSFCRRNVGDRVCGPPLAYFVPFSFRLPPPSSLLRLFSFASSLVFLPRLVGARPYSNVRSGRMHGGEPNYLS